jgi:hypothetical protein
MESEKEDCRIMTWTLQRILSDFSGRCMIIICRMSLAVAENASNSMDNVR